jgi:hypothetical protein
MLGFNNMCRGTGNMSPSSESPQMRRISSGIPEPEFLNILKCNSAESASAEFQFNCYSFFNDKTPNYRHLDHISGLLKFDVKQSFKSFNKNCSL